MDDKWLSHIPKDMDKKVWRQVAELKRYKLVDPEGYYSVVAHTFVTQQQDDRYTCKTFNTLVGKLSYAADLPPWEVIEHDFQRVSGVIEDYLNEHTTLEGRYIVDLNEDGDIDIFYIEES